MTIGIGIGIWVGLWGSLLVPQQTVLTARFNTPGPVALPSWLTYTCASTSTVRTGLSTVLKGIAVNQAVANIYGLQVECTSTNYCLQSDNFNTAAWTNDAGTWSFLQTDPYGGQAGCKIQGASYGLHQILAQTSTVFSVSSYYMRSGATNSSACVALRTSSTTLTSFVENPVQSESYQRTEKTYNGVSAASANLWFQNSDYGGAINSNCTFAFPQVELLPFSTSYIPTGATAVTRAAGNLNATLPDVTDLTFDLEFVASCSPTTVFSSSQYKILVGNTRWFGWDYLSGVFTVNNGTAVYTGGIPLVWNANDTVRFAITINYSASTVSYQVFVNGTKIANETLNINFVFGSNVVGLFARAGLFHVSPRGIRKIVITPLSWSTINATSFTTPGVTTLPSWLSFTCASTRTAEVSSTQLLKGVSVNQVVINRWGLQHETTDTNYFPQSDSLSTLNPLGGTQLIRNITDPNGGVQGVTVTGDPSSPYRGALATLYATGSSATHTVSGWVRKPLTGSNFDASILAYDNTTPGALYAKETPPAEGWHRISASSTATLTMVYAYLNDKGAYSPQGLLAGCNADFAFPSYSKLPFATSYIPTTTAAVTRAPSILKATLPDVTDMKITLSFVASHAPTVVMGAVTILLGNVANNATYVGYQDSTGKLIVSTPGGQVFSVGVLSWVAGDNVSIDISPRYTSKTTSFVVRVNGAQVLSETLTSTDNPKFDATQVNVGSDYTGTYHLSPKGLVSLSVAVPSTPQPPGNFGTLLAAWDARYNITKTGNAVTAWTPYLGDASIVLTGTATYNINRGDGKPELTFNGTSQQLNSTATSLATIPLGNYALVMVCNRTSPAGRVTTLMGGGASNRLIDYYSGDGITQIILTVDSGTVNAGQVLPNAVNKRQANVLSRALTTIRTTTSTAGVTNQITVVKSGVSVAATRLSIAAFDGGGPLGTVNISAIYLFKSEITSGREPSVAAMATHPTNYPVL